MNVNDCCDRNFKFRHTLLKDPRQVYRYKVLKYFVDSEPLSISLGCGAYEPILINTQYASDISPNAENYLKQLGYKGKFILADVRNLPFVDKAFNVAICSEVIEHLPDPKSVISAFSEINRVAVNWLISTPAFPSPDPDHKIQFSKYLLDHILDSLHLKNKSVIFKKDFYFYISNNEKRLFNALFKAKQDNTGWNIL